jgi:hypothetical protein
MTTGHAPPPAPHRIHPSVRLLARRNLLLALGLIAGSLLVGMVGFHLTAGYDGVESFSQAALLLGGEGPSGTYPTDASKLFAGAYALYCGLAYILVTGLLLAPVFSHVLKRHRLDVGGS